MIIMLTLWAIGAAILVPLIQRDIKRAIARRQLLELIKFLRGPAGDSLREFQRTMAQLGVSAAKAAAGLKALGEAVAAAGRQDGSR